MYSTFQDPVEICPGLFLGSAKASRGKEELLSKNVSLIINCAMEIENAHPDSFNYINLQLGDEVDENVLSWYQQKCSNVLCAFPCDLLHYLAYIDSPGCFWCCFCISLSVICSTTSFKASARSILLFSSAACFDRLFACS